MNRMLLSLAAAATLVASLVAPAVAEEGVEFYTSHGVYATITKESFWEDREGNSGFDAWVRFGDGSREKYGVVCHGATYGTNVYNTSSGQRFWVAAYGPARSGIDGYYQDLFHNVCFDENIY